METGDPEGTIGRTLRGAMRRNKTQKKWSVALVGDLHYGSKYRLDWAIKDFYKKAKSHGCTVAFQVGDILEGQYRHHHPQDLDGHGFDEQAALCVNNLPDCIPTEYIEGNHDETLGKANGSHAGKMLESYARSHGRDDLTYHASRQVLLQYRGLRVCLFHPSFGMPKSARLGVTPTRQVPTSHLERFLVSLADCKEKPDIVAIGHWHQSSYMQYRGMNVFLCGTFQGPGGSFSNSLGDNPAVGSWIVDIEKSRGKTIVSPKWVGYESKRKLIKVEKV